MSHGSFGAGPPVGRKARWRQLTPGGGPVLRDVDSLRFPVSCRRRRLSFGSLTKHTHTHSAAISSRAAPRPSRSLARSLGRPARSGARLACFRGPAILARDSRLARASLLTPIQFVLVNRTTRARAPSRVTGPHELRPTPASERASEGAGRPEKTTCASAGRRKF